MGKTWDQFRLLMWKNWLMQLRHPTQSVLEVLIPIVFCMALVIMRAVIKVTYKDENIYPVFNIADDGGYTCYGSSITQIAYSPKNVHIESIMGKVQERMASSIALPENLDCRVNILGYGTEKELENTLSRNHDYRTVGVVFDDKLKYNDALPKDIKFALRFQPYMNTADDDTWMSDKLFQFILDQGPREDSEVHGATPYYFEKLFLTLQYMVSEELIRNFISDDNIEMPAVSFMRYPYPTYVKDSFQASLQFIITVVIVMSFLYTSISLIKVITQEKENQLKESMKIMGLPNWMHWAAWFLKSICFMLITVIIVTILITTNFWYSGDDKGIFVHSNEFLVFCFLFLYACSLITLCFLISSFFTKANYASAAGGIILFLIYIPFTIVQSKYDEYDLSVKLVFSLLSQTAMGFGFQLISMHESTGKGLQWNNIFKTVTTADDLTFGYVCLMMLLDTVLYLLICLYVEAIFPGEYGVPKKWNFIFTWMCRSKSETVPELESYENLDPQNYEADPQELKPGIEIRKLHKIFNSKVAVNNLSLKMYNNQITVLLGHNGAGKTTTMSMLTGMIPPSAGTALVNDYDICNDIDNVRNSLGLCPQHNILFDELTVEEHIYFFSRMKGMDVKDIDDEIDQYLKLLDFEPKRKAMSASLSGGMKRKLSVAMAFCGNSRVVMLDEPTAGMDPSARRALWELVQAQKKDRTILLSTHFMDEADLLGDRIAIMAGGILKCCGSGFFLKKRYGAGYYLIIDKGEACDVNAVTKLLQTHIPSIRVYNNIGSELTYLLNNEDVPIFEKMLHHLENNKRMLDIRSYGISLTNLEEVFLKVGADHLNNAEEHETVTNQIHAVNVETKDEELLTGFDLLKNQIFAMILKRAILSMRSWMFMLFLVVYPIIIIIISVTSTRAVSDDLPSRDMTISDYKSPIITIKSDSLDNKYYQSVTNLFENENRKFDDIKENLVDYLMKAADNDITKYRLNHLFALSISSDEIIAAFNNIPYHTPALSLQYAMNAIAQSFSDDIKIKVVNHPLPNSDENRLEDLSDPSTLGFNLAMNISFCMAFISAYFVLFYIREHANKVKHQQYISGINLFVFWLVSFVWDYLFYFIITVIQLLVLLALQEDPYLKMSDTGHLYAIYAIFGFAMLPMVYLFSLVFKTPATGFIRIVLISILFGTLMFLVVQILYLTDADLDTAADIIDKFLMIIPYYSISKSIVESDKELTRVSKCNSVIGQCVEFGYAGITMTEDMCRKLHCNADSSICCRVDADIFAWGEPGILHYTITSLLVGILLFAILFLIEFGIVSSVLYRFEKKHPPQYDSDGDSDVAAEAQKVRNMSEDEKRKNVLVLQDMTKYYKQFRAVNGISLAVNTRECFGLLGVNGAGKTTTFKMITGDISITSGDAYIFGYNLKTQLKDIRHKIGYCPQFNALFDDLSARETIKIFALIRGYTPTAAAHMALKLSEEFDFLAHIDKLVKQLSGGNKRKLSSALTLLGDPPIIYLDEPTAGMDPATRRYLWNALCKLRDRGKTLVLTSHSMEECEALCTRLAIMVNGRFQCIGSTQHLKNKFAEGYTLIIKQKKRQADVNGNLPEMQSVDKFVAHKFPTAQLREQHQEMWTYFIPSSSMPWSQMFGIMENAKQTLNMEDYSIGQSSLEQVFLTFTNEQKLM